jgi:hypothetical protein
MKLTKQQLKAIIKEELESVLSDSIQGSGPRYNIGIDWESLLGPGKFSDDQIIQMMELVAAGGQGDRHQAQAERFVEEFREALAKLEATNWGGLENKDNWTDEQKTQLHALSDDIRFYRDQGSTFLEAVGLLGRSVDR